MMETGCTPASINVPTAAMGCALVKISASGPMPTSRYWLQAFCSISTCFRCAASGEPGFSFARSSPTRRVTSARIAAAAVRSPRARSSITRSSIEIAKVTPAALIACRSIGASSQGLARSRVRGGVLARSVAHVAERFALDRAHARGGIGHLAQVAHGRAERGDVERRAVSDRDHRRPVEVRPPDPPDRAWQPRRPPATPPDTDPS